MEFLAPVEDVERIPANFVRFVWKQGYACGHPVIDEQHQHLFQTSNDLFDAITSDHPREVIFAIIARLLNLEIS